ncbi:DedA family protein [Saccharopolyspora sp. NPDC003752]
MFDLVHSVLAGVPPILLLTGACLVLIVEAGFLVGLVLPGTSVLFAAGLCARHGIVPLGPTMLVVATGAVLGAQLGYLRGRQSGVPPRMPVPILVRRLGLAAVAGGQWLSGARVLTPRLAASTGMPYRRFAVASIPSTTLWASCLAGTGYAAGLHVARLLNSALSGVGVLFALSIAIVAWRATLRARS